MRVAFGLRTVVRLPSLGIRWASTAPDPAKRLGPIEQKVYELVNDLEQSSRTQTAEEIKALKPVSYGDAAHVRPDLERTRVVPRHMAFYMSNPRHEEVVRRLEQLVLRYINLPTVDPKNYKSSKWINPAEEESGTTRRLTGPQKRIFSDLVRRLDRIDPQLIPREVESVLACLRSDSQGSGQAANQRKVKTLDEQGRAIAVGHRKSASARVILVRAQDDQVGQIYVNGRSIEEAFPTFTHRQCILYPFRVVDAVGKFNVWATVQGGGSTGQADSVAHGVAQALVVQNPLLRSRLNRASLLKRDLRVKERKKPGLAKARKAYTWVKR